MAEVRTSRSDADIQEVIERIITHYPPLVLDRHHINVQVSNGKVTVSGYIRTRITRKYFVDALRHNPEITELDADTLYSDEDIRLDVGQQIPAGVQSNIDHGAVVLTGRLPEGAQADQVVKAVQGVRGVRAVHTRFM